jgi:hypothetical protein
LVVLVFGIIAILAFQAASLRVFREVSEYSRNFSTTVTLINSNTGIYQERDYYVATSYDLSVPDNGLIVLNPIQKLPQETTLPSLQSAVYSVENNTERSLNLRLTNSRRTEERSGQAPPATYLGLSFTSATQRGSWQATTLFNNNSEGELVDSALLFGSASATQTTVWRGRTSLYLLDGGLTLHAAAILPGVDILNDTGAEGQATAVIYSTRALSIGGIMTEDQDREAAAAIDDASTESLRVDQGIIEASEASANILVPGTAALAMDTDMRITGTDILLVAPAGTRPRSTLRAPAAHTDAQSTEDLQESTAPHSGNNLTVSGGVIGVGTRCTLTIGPDANGLGSVELSPRSLIVDGGTLIIEPADAGAITINSDIQVRNGGRLVIGEGATINGNIYAFGGGTVEVNGSFKLYGHQVGFDEGSVPGGIFILADNSTDEDGAILGLGYFTAKILWMIDGSDGSNLIIKSRAVHFLSTAAPPGYPLMYNEYSCPDSATSSHLCEHFGVAEGLTAPAVIVDFSDDMAVIESFRSASS